MPELNKQESWEEEFDERFVVDTDPTEFPFVGMYDKDSYKFEFWRADKIKDFIRSQRQLARKELLEELKKRMPEEALDGIGGWNQPFANGFNSYRSDVLEIINQLKEE